MSLNYAQTPVEVAFDICFIFLRKKWIFTLFLFQIFSLNPIWGQADSVTLDPSQQVYPITDAIEVLVDPSGKLYPDEALRSDGWMSIKEATQQLPDSMIVHWLRFKIHNLEGSSFESYKISVAFTDYVSMHVLTGDGNFSEQKSGDLYGLDKRAVTNGKLVFTSLSIPYRSTRTILMRLESKTDISWQFRAKALKSLQAYSEEGFTSRFETPRFYQAFFYGAVLIMIFYNLFIFISLRSNEYLLYVFHLIALTIFFMSNGGYLMELFLPNSPRIDLYIRFVSTPIVLITYIGFSINFLNTNKEFKAYHKILLSLIALYVLDIFMMVVLGEWNIARTASIVLALISYIIIFIIAFKGTRRGYTPARYFLVANLVLILGALAFAIPRFIGVVQNPLTQYGVQLGVILEVALLSIGLADRINVAKREANTLILERTRLEKEQEKEKKALIEAKNQELEEKVVQRTKKVMEQKEAIEKINQSLTDSIQYAKRIQQAILGDEKRLNTFFDESFILLLPRDIVSGDFFWVGETHGKQVVIAADCTGHGVPGAFMTVMGHSLLNEIINELGVWKPHHILKILDEKIRQNLHADQGGSNDGMDISILTFDQEANTLWFSGAKNPLCFISNNEMTRIKGSSSSVGGRLGKRGHVYDVHEVPYQQGDFCFIFSDGFQDQFGGDKGRKFLSTQFRKLLFSNIGKPMKQQQQLLKETFYQWKGDYKQTDDILVIGIKL